MCNPETPTQDEANVEAMETTASKVTSSPNFQNYITLNVQSLTDTDCWNTLLSANQVIGLYNNLQSYVVFNIMKAKKYI